MVFATAVCPIFSKGKQSGDDIRLALQDFFQNYTPQDGQLPNVARLVSYHVDDFRKTLTVKANSVFAVQDFTKSNVKKIYRKVSRVLPKPYDKYRIKIVCNGLSIDELIPEMRYDDSEMPNMWGDIEYDGRQWVSNVSRPNTITHGLANRHLSVWASHGMYYDQSKGLWKWQRPNLFGTTEDLFTQTIVVPYLIPMLESAGATVFSPRERDSQPNEIIVDNDKSIAPSYVEFEDKGRWSTTSHKGFSYHAGHYDNSENPFPRQERHAWQKPQRTPIKCQPQPISPRFRLMGNMLYMSATRLFPIACRMRNISCITKDSTPHCVSTNRWVAQHGCISELLNLTKEAAYTIGLS